MARLWRSCGSARKTSRIARSCRVCRRCNISRYRQTVCTAARSGTCDRRERSVRHLTAVRRATPKKIKKGRVLQGRGTRARRATAQAAGSARSVDLHGGAAMVAGRQGTGGVHPLAFADDAAQAELVGALTAQGLHPTEQINRCCFRSVCGRRRAACCSRSRPMRQGFTRRRAERDPGQRDQAAALVRVPPRRDRGGVGAAAPIAGAATRRGAMEPQNSYLRAWRAVYSFSAPMVTKQLCLRTGTRRT